MDSKDSTIRVKAYTKERIIKHAKRLGLTQGEFIEKAILSAEKYNFSEEDFLTEVKKFTTENTNRLIGFLKVQDKNLITLEENIYSIIQRKLYTDELAIIEHFYMYILNKIQEEQEQENVTSYSNIFEKKENGLTAEDKNKMIALIDKYYLQFKASIKAKREKERLKNFDTSAESKGFDKEN